jgi:hypothetical protein
VACPSTSWPSQPVLPTGEHSPLGLFFGEGGDGFAACLVRGINTENRPARGGCLHHHCPKLVSSDPRRERQRREHERGQRQRRDHHRRNVNPASPNHITHVLISRTSDKREGSAQASSWPFHAGGRQPPCVPFRESQQIPGALLWFALGRARHCHRPRRPWQAPRPRGNV